MSTTNKGLRVKTMSSVPNLDLNTFRKSKSHSKPLVSENSRQHGLLEQIIFERSQKKYNLTLPPSEGPSLLTLSGFRTTRSNNLVLSHKKSNPKPLESLAKRSRFGSEDFNQAHNEQIGSSNSLESHAYFTKASATLPDEDNFKLNPSYMTFTPQSKGQIPSAFQKKSSRENIIDGLYTSTKEIKEEINAIMLKQYDEELKKQIENRNIKNFSATQKERIKNLTSILEKKLSTSPKASPTGHDIIKLVHTELNRIRKSYDEFLLIQSKSNPPKIKTPTADGSCNIWKAFQLLIQHSSLYQDFIPTIRGSKEFELSQIYQTISTFKKDFKSHKDFDRQAIETFQQIQDHIRHLNKVIDATKEKVESMANQYQALLESYKDLEGKNTGITGEIVKMIQEVKNNKRIQKQEEGESLPLYQQKYLEYLVDDFRDTNQKLTEELELYKEKLAHEKRQTEEAERLRLKLKAANSCDKAVMTHLLPENTSPVLNINLSSYLQNPILYSSGIPLTDKMTNSIINLLYSDKMAGDLCDEFDRRPRKSLRSYLPQWFLKRFGIYSFSETILQNLMYTLNSRNQLNKKFDLFENLLGIEESTAKDDHSIDPQQKNIVVIDRKKMKLTCYNTAEMNHYFFQLLNRIRKMTSKNLKSPTQPNDFLYKPFLCISQDANDDVVDIDLALELLSIVVKEQKFTLGEAKNLEAQFNTVQEHDLYIRVMKQAGNYREEKLKIEESTSPQKAAIDINLFLKLVLDAVVNKHINTIETSYTMIRANTPSRNEVDISFDEYSHAINKIMPTTTQAWREQSYCKLINEAGGNKIPLSQLMPDFVSCYFHEDQVKDTHQQQPQLLKIKVKKETSDEPDSSSSSSVKRTELRKPSPNLEDQKQKSAKNLVGKYKELYSGLSPVISDKAYEAYDVYSSVVLLQETYELLRNSIATHEKGFEELRIANEEFLVEFYGIFGNIHADLDPESWIPYKKRDLVCFIEHLWTLLRSIVICIYRSYK